MALPPTEGVPLGLAVANEQDAGHPPTVPIPVGAAAARGGRGGPG